MRPCLVKILLCVLGYFLSLASTSSKPTISNNLSEINLMPRKGQKINITLSNIGHLENCSLDRIPTSDSSRDDYKGLGVLSHNSTKFVSCRYELGPIDMRYVGTWKICGRTEDDFISDRCQPIVILGTEDDCPVTTHPTLHIVGAGNYAIPTDQSDTAFTECHVVTPNGEDLIVTENSDFPGIKLLDNNYCKVIIKREKIMTENWRVYGRRTDAFSCKEVRYPIRIYGISASEDDDKTIHYNKGDFAEIFVVTFPNTASKCYLVTPQQIEIDFPKDGTKYELRPSNGLSSCIVRINDLDKTDEGLWSLHAVTSSGEEVVHLNIVINGPSSEDQPDDNDLSVTEMHLNKGDFAEIFVMTFSSAVSKCYLVDPENLEVDFQKDGSKYELRPRNALSSCIVRINDLDKADEGLWSLHAEMSSGEEVVRVDISINGASSENQSNKNDTSESESSEDSSVAKKESDEDVSTEDSKSSAEVDTSEESTSAEGGSSQPQVSEEKTPELESSESSSSEEDNTQWLTEQQFLTRTGLSVDINLPLIARTEKCTFKTPDGSHLSVEESTVAGVTVYNSSDYVSCRIVVGPMEPSLTGTWEICGSYIEDNVEHKRCQSANIAWRNAANPDTTWQTIIQPTFNHVVHFGGILRPSARGSGNVVSCHLVTPNNEDLLVTRESTYPNIELVQDTDSACSIAIGPITQSHLGSWAIYAKLNSALSGYNEVRLPMNLDLYDKNNPHEQAYNVTNLNPIQHVVNLGSTISVEVTSTGAVDVCLFTMPSGMSYNTIDHAMPTGVSFVNDNRVTCRISIGPITQAMIGSWILNGKFSNRDIFTERIQSFTIIQEDPSNPIQEEDRTVEYLAEQLFETDIGATQRVVITQPFLNTIQSCHIITPEGLQYTFMEGFNIPGIEIVTGSNIQCSVNVKVSEDIIGDWTLIAREIRSSERIERRLPFKIYVEEYVDALPNEITITEGNALQVRLLNPTILHETCKLVGPDEKQPALASSDGRYIDSCGFVVTSVDAQHTGTWHIVYGTKIIYKAPVLVTVNARLEHDDLHLSWLEYSAVRQIVGPEDTVYCRIISPKQVVLFDDFGRCQIELDNVLFDLHAGEWTMEVGLPGRIVTETHRFQVDVKAEDEKPEVTITVRQDKPIVELTCELKSAEEKTGCLFRNPQGEVLVASQGVRENRYAFHVNQTSSASDEFYYSCGLQITDPVTSDLGLWRCDLESEEHIYFGFLSVLCPWAMQDPEVAASVIAEPVLTPVVPSVLVAEREPAVLACSARAPLRYCYFRAPNGTIYNVRPGSSTGSAAYAGAGLDAGECGVRVSSLAPRDSGTWGCHAGFHGAPEQSHPITVLVDEEFVVSSSRESMRLVVQGQVRGFQPLEYCRFVRIDGYGFTSDNPPFPYVDESILSQGLCRIRVAHAPTDLHPWTVVAKIQGRGEMSRVTGHSWPEPPVLMYNSLYMWLPVLMILTFTLALSAACAPAKNRRWAAERASSVRTSFRRFSSLRKKPAPHPQTNHTNSAA